MYKPTKAKIFDPGNADLALADAICAEIHGLESPETYWWKLDSEVLEEDKEILTDADDRNDDQASYLDDLDEVYKEKSSKDGNKPYVDYTPIQVYGKLDTQPIIQEISRLGIVDKTEIDFYMNIADCTERLGRPPTPGDIFRITYLINDQSSPTMGFYAKFVFYTVATVQTVDLFNFQYMNYQVLAEQQNLSDVPDEITTFDFTEAL